MLQVPQLPGYEAHATPGIKAHKEYVCPSCGNVIPAGQGHVVAWPVDAADLRRHWHRHCWRMAVRRGRIA